MVKTTRYIIGLGDSVKWFKKGILEIPADNIPMGALLADYLVSIVTRYVLQHIKPNIQETLEYIRDLNPGQTLLEIVEVGLVDPEHFDTLFVDYAVSLVMNIHKHLQITSMHDAIALEGIGVDYIVINVYQESGGGNIHYR